MIGGFKLPNTKNIKRIEKLNKSNRLSPTDCKKHVIVIIDIVSHGLYNHARAFEKKYHCKVQYLTNSETKRFLRGLS